MEEEEDEDEDEYEEVLEMSRLDERQVEGGGLRNSPPFNNDEDEDVESYDDDDESNKNIDISHFKLKAKDSGPLRTSQLGEDIPSDNNKPSHSEEDGRLFSLSIAESAVQSASFVGDRGRSGNADAKHSGETRLAPGDAPAKENGSNSRAKQLRDDSIQLDDNEARIVELLRGDDRVEELRGESGGFGDNFSGASEASEAEEACDY